MKWYASAPSNIALIKYMGKVENQFNHPTNASLSYTLPHLISHVELEARDGSAQTDCWEPLEIEGAANKINLSDKGKIRFLLHLERIKEHLNYRGFFVVRSTNDFPSDCGLASSASSFAALTLCAYRAIKELMAIEPSEFEEEQMSSEIPIMSKLSRMGSGSSCRSFYAPWSEWKGDNASEIKLPFSRLHHMVVIAENEKKKISSSDAHVRVVQSELFTGRKERAEKRLDELKKSLHSKNWKNAYEICWSEFWDMHALFETSSPPFGYMNNGSIAILEVVRNLWENEGDGPIVTMDAGPNVHLLFRLDQDKCFVKLKQNFSEKFGIYSHFCKH